MSRSIFYWVEDPIQMNGFAALADLRRRIPQKITASETLATRRQFLDLVAADAVDIVMLDIGWCGGITEAKAIASIAEARSLPIAPHDCTGPIVFGASCHMSVHAPNTLIQERVRAFHTGWHLEICDESPVFDRGMIRPPEGPGLGMSLKPELFERADATMMRWPRGGFTDLSQNRIPDYRAFALSGSSKTGRLRFLKQPVAEGGDFCRRVLSPALSRYRQRTAGC